MVDLSFGAKSFTNCTTVSFSRLSAPPSRVDIPYLHTLSFGAESFSRMDTFAVTGFSGLTSILFDDRAFSSLTDLSLADLPKLEIITAHNYSCYHVKTLELSSGDRRAA